MTNKQIALCVAIGVVIAQILLEPSRRKQRKLLKEQEDKIIDDTVTELVNDAFPDFFFKS